MLVDPSLEPNKIRWQCRRGTLELDALLLAFFEHEYGKLAKIEQQLFVKFLANSDQDLYNWLVANSEPPPEQYCVLVDHIKRHHSTQL